MNIRPATAADAAAIWRVLEPMIREGETYALPRDMSETDALAFWMGEGREAFVASDDGQIVGIYYLRPNQMGGGGHVCNCGYITAADSAGRGVARAMHEHSLQQARDRGFRAMQFNFVISSNDRAVRLWQSLGFETIGRLPGAFLSPSKGYVDALVMHRVL